MRVALKRHPDFPNVAADALSVEIVQRARGVLALRYVAVGAIGRLRTPAPAMPVRADGLWRSTCFELFVRPAGSEAYWEFNFAPSRAWAAYRFSGYRADMENVDLPAAPQIEAAREADAFVLSAAIDLSTLPSLVDARLAVSAVLEGEDGAKSYWAQAHPPGKPDFHHSESFALDCPASEDS